MRKDFFIAEDGRYYYGKRYYKKIKPFIIYSVPIILLIAVVAIFGVYKWNQGQGIININDAKLTSSKVMVVAQK